MDIKRYLKLLRLKRQKPDLTDESAPPSPVRNLRSISQGMLGRSSGLILYVLITILVVSLFVGKYGFLEKLATGMQDGMFKFRGKVDVAPAEIVIVGIDDRSVDNLAPWPWPRDLLAQSIYLISQGSPKAIGLDVFLPDQVDEDTSGRTDILADEIYASGNIFLPIYFSLSDVGIAPEPAPAWVKSSAVGETGNFSRSWSSTSHARQIYYPSSSLAEESRGFGHINIHYDGDGLVRKEPLLIDYDGQLYPSFALRLASAYLRVKPSDIRLQEEEGVLVGKVLIPTDKNLHMLVDYLGPNMSFKRISALTLFTGEVGRDTFKDKIVLVGLTSTESKTWIQIPAFGQINEVERIATVAENIIQRDFLKHLSAFWNVLTLILIGVFCALVLPKVSLSYRIVILMVFLFVIFNFSYIMFSSFGTLTKPVYPIIELVFFLIASPAIKAKKSREEVTEADESEVGFAEDRFEDEVRSVRTEEEEQEEPDGDLSTRFSSSKLVAERSQEPGSDTPKGQSETLTRKQETPLPGETPPSASEQTMQLPKTPLPDVPPERSSTPFPSEKTPSISQFGRYKIVEVLGRGGMGTVYKGLDPVLDRPVALKTIRLDFALSSSEVSELRERLIQEAKAAGRLSHPNIVTIYDVGEEGGQQYIAMEYLSGYTLEDFIKKKGVLNYRIVAKIIMQTCEALSYAHSHGIVHRDIKPANIMLLDDFHAKVMDFGIARLEATSLTKSNVALGTPHYISPEQLEGKPADKRSDIFSLGVVMYELLTRQKPFQGENISTLMYHILNYQPPAPSSIDDKSPLVFDHVVSKAMAKIPEERYQDAEEISKIMREFVSSFVVTRSIRI